MATDATRRGAADEPGGPACCPLYHEAIEFIGRRWTGAIVAVLLEGGAMRFTEIGQRVPAVSDRLLSERLRELEEHGLVRRDVAAGPPVQVLYELTPIGRELGPVIGELRTWARRWFDQRA